MAAKKKIPASIQKKKKQKEEVKTGRKPELNAETQKRICDMLKIGQTMTTAAEYGGVSRKTVEEWIRRGEDRDRRESEEIYAAFAAAVKDAKLTSKIRNVTLITEAAKKHWTAAAWWLERNYPEEYGRRTALEHSGKIEQPPTKKQVIKIGDVEVEF